MGFSTVQGSSAHTQFVLKIENFVSCVMLDDRDCDQMEEALEQTAQITSRSSIIFGSAKSSCDAHSGHVHVSFTFYQLF